jgi:hypothetical protein
VTDKGAIVEREAGLHKALTRGRITMMSLGLYMGSIIAHGRPAA